MTLFLSINRDYKNPTGNFKYTITSKDSYFQKMTGREIDVFDEKKQRFFQKPARPAGSTTTVVTMKNPDGTISREKQSMKWNATKHK
mmetsp:Transcript_4305/g.3612  ORF Transcript_4305/g.3612 Transcript_4305/m.3612 type:complete len:87 (-) Transcript_4305:200-460(-)